MEEGKNPKPVAAPFVVVIFFCKAEVLCFTDSGISSNFYFHIPWTFSLM